MAELKLTCSEMGVPSSIIVEALSKLKERLFYLQSDDDKFFFSDQPNLNHILITKMNNIPDERIREEEKEALSRFLSKEFFEIYIWPKNTKDIPDTRKIKLIVLQNDDKKFCEDIIENYGGNPRVHKNTLIFLCPKSSKRVSFDDFLRRKIAWEAIREDKQLALTESQRREVEEKIKSLREDFRKKIRELYRVLYLPSKDGLEEIDMGAPVIDTTNLGKEIFEKLVDEGKIVTKIDPVLLKEKYLKGKDYINVKVLLDSFYNAPGELRIPSDNVLKECVKNGVAKGIFGYGVLEGEKPICKYFKSEFTPEITEDDILIQPELCGISEEGVNLIQKAEDRTKEQISWDRLSEQKSTEEKYQEIRGEVYKHINLVLEVPEGKFSDMRKIIGFLKTKFKDVRSVARVEISATNGSITLEEYEKIKEAIEQAQIKIEDEKKG